MLKRAAACLAIAIIAACVDFTAPESVAACHGSASGNGVTVHCTDRSQGARNDLPQRRYFQEPQKSSPPTAPHYAQGPVRDIGDCNSPRYPDYLRPMCYSVPRSEPDPGPAPPQQQPEPRISPEQAAREAVATLELPTPTIRYGPRPEDTYYKMHFIGVPYWYWTTNTGGQRTHTVTHQGITITYSTCCFKNATARCHANVAASAS